LISARIRRGLPAADPAADHDRAAGQHRRPQERLQRPVEGAAPREVAEVGEVELVLADRQARPRRDVHDREQPRAVRQPQVQLRLGRVEAPLGPPGPGRGGAQQLDQLGVGVRDRLAPVAAAVGVLEPDRVAPLDVDVGDAFVVEVALQPAEPEQPVERLPGDLVLDVLRQRVEVVAQPPAGLVVERGGDQAAGVGPLVRAREVAVAARPAGWVSRSRASRSAASAANRCASTATSASISRAPSRSVSRA
jgi:hypothetical protein